MEGNIEPGAISVHSPASHNHSNVRKISLSSSSNTEDGDSDISDMIVDNLSRFEGLSKQRRKSGGSDYRPEPSDSNPASESESGSMTNSSNEDYSERSTPFSSKQDSPVTRLSEEDSEGASNRSLSIPPRRGHNHFNKTSPIVRKSPLNVSHRSSPSEVTAMRGHRYSMLPSRSVAMNVSYSRYLGEDSNSDDDDNNFPVQRKGKRKQLVQSESEFEVSGRSEESISEEISNSGFSEEDYQPPRRKNRSKRKVSGWAREPHPQPTFRLTIRR